MFVCMPVDMGRASLSGYGLRGAPASLAHWVGLESTNLELALHDLSRPSCLCALQKLDLVRPQDYFTRFSWSVQSRKFSPEQVAIYCRQARGLNEDAATTPKHLRAEACNVCRMFKSRPRQPAHQDTMRVPSN